MIAVAVPLLLLLLWNVIYCGIKAYRDSRGGNPALGAFGILAALGPLGLLALIVFALLIGVSGV